MRFGPWECRMLRFRSTTLLVLPLWFTPFFACAQANDPALTRNSSSPASSGKSTDQVFVASAPIPSNAPRISKQTRYEIIRDFETQLVYARTSFPMGTKGLQLKHGVITP